MGIGIGILLLVIGLIILFAINEFPASLQEVVEAVGRAELGLQKVTAVRDRVIAAYQEILRMPI